MKCRDLFTSGSDVFIVSILNTIAHYPEKYQSKLQQPYTHPRGSRKVQGLASIQCLCWPLLTSLVLFLLNRVNVLIQLILRKDMFEKKKIFHVKEQE